MVSYLLLNIFLHFFFFLASCSFRTGLRKINFKTKPLRHLVAEFAHCSTWRMDGFGILKMDCTH